MPPKEKRPGAMVEEEEPLEEDKELLEKELVISYLKMKLFAYAPFDLRHRKLLNEIAL